MRWMRPPCGRIFAAKGRPHSSPLIVHVADLAMARELAREWPPEAEKLAAAFWPGPLTIIVPKSDKVPDLVTAGLPSVALRMPAHPIALAVIRAAGIPLAAPSANRFTQLSPTTAQHVRDALGDAVALIVDGGPCTVGIESTVISLTGPIPKILRPGMITANANRTSDRKGRNRRRRRITRPAPKALQPENTSSDRRIPKRRKRNPPRHAGRCRNLRGALLQ